MRFCQLFIIRHSPTDWNEEGRIQGRAGQPLSEKGKSHAQEQSMKFSEYAFSMIYASPLERAKETALIISKKQKCPIELADDLQEGNMGFLEGLSREQFKEKYKEDLQRQRNLSLSERFHFKIDPGAESPLEIALRSFTCLKAIASKHLGEKILIVTHAWVIRSLFIFLQKHPKNDDFFITHDAEILIHGNKKTLSLIDFNGIKQGPWI